jgi:multiple sugar transport system permease protein
MTVLKRSHLLNRKTTTAMGWITSHIVLIAGSLLIMVPIFWMITSSLKSEAELYIFPPKWLPDPPLWRNYIDSMVIYPFARYFLNTTVITALSILGTLISCTLAAFGFSHFRFPGRDAVFITLLATMMLPGTVTLAPIYILSFKLGWIDTYYPLTVPNFFGDAFYIFLLRQFFVGIPSELKDSARIDGCNSLDILWRIILPLSTPALATVAIFRFMDSWNDFIGPLIYINSSLKRTVAIALALFQNSSQHGPPPNLNLLMAVSFVSLVPCVLLFFFAQRWFIQGIVFKGLKG